MNAPDTTPAKGRRLSKNIRIDMTPMVDLGFLLITFFIFTSSMSETKAMRLYMPADGKRSTVSEENVVSLIVTANTIYAYEGKWVEAKQRESIFPVSLGQPGIGKLITDKKKRMHAKDPSDNLMVLIKPLADAEYKDLVDLLDEMIIHEVPSYAIVEPSAEESNVKM